LTRTEKKKLFRKIATEVRKELQTIAPHFNTGWGTANVAKSLNGYCGFGSTMIWQALKAEGFKPKIINGVGHWFVVCDDILVDVTASQFSQPMVCVREYKTVEKIIESGERSMGFWKNTKASNTPAAAGLNDNEAKIEHARQKAKEL